MRRQRGSAFLRFFFIVFQVIKHLGGYLIFRLLKGLRLMRRGRGRGLWRDLTGPERLRLFLQEVDGAIIKIGQILAMRVDFLSDDYIQELLKLLDEVPPFNPAVAKQIIEEELHGSLPELFKTFDEVPLAAASFGQAHAATLHSGEKVVVKVQRPGIARTIDADLKLFRLTAFLVDATGLTRRTPIKPIYEEFAEWTREELDYRIEGSHVQEVHDKAVGSETEHIPEVYWSHTTARVLTLERLHGIWVKEIMEGLQYDRGATIRRLADLDTNLTEISQNLLRNTLRQIFVYGIYHADPHGANLLVMKDGVIGYVDFGITGRIGEESKDIQVKIHLALESGDFEQFYLAILETMSPPQGADLSAFRTAVRRGYIGWLNSQYMSHSNTQEKSFARLMLRLNEAARRNGLAFRSMELRIFRALATVDAVILDFAPTLDVRSEFRHFFGAYKVVQVVKDKIPKLIHQLPALLDMLSDCMEHTFISHTARVSKLRKGLGVFCHVLSLALVALGLAALFAPVTARAVLGRLNLGAGSATILLLLGVVFFAWIGSILKLRSVIHFTVMEHHHNSICSGRER